MTSVKTLKGEGVLLGDDVAVSYVIDVERVRGTFQGGGYVIGVPQAVKKLLMRNEPCTLLLANSSEVQVVLLEATSDGRCSIATIGTVPLDWV